LLQVSLYFKYVRNSYLQIKWQASSHLTQKHVPRQRDWISEWATGRSADY